MEQLEFVNKMWVSSKPKLWERCLLILIEIYCALQIFIFIMDGIDLRSSMYLILAIAVFFWCRSAIKRNGNYVTNDCVLRFENGQLEWEYPHMKIEGTKRQLRVLYTIKTADIRDIALSREMHSVRIVCRPIMETMEKNKKKITDFHKREKDCVLVLYYDKIEEVLLLLRKYVSNQITIVD